VSDENVTVSLTLEELGDARVALLFFANTVEQFGNAIGVEAAESAARTQQADRYRAVCAKLTAALQTS
jgi:hypothetical protein